MTHSDGLVARRMNIRREPLIAAVGAVALVIAMAVSTTYWPADKPIPGQRAAFNPASYAQDNYQSKIVPAIEGNAVDLPTLVSALGADADAAGTKYGKRDGTAPWSYSVRANGVAGEPVNGLLPLRVDGIPADTRVSVQIGPAVNGTALRDASGVVHFNDFVNQVEYADAAIALNQAMAKGVLASVDAKTLAGKTITVVGATTPLNPRLFTITAVSIKAGP
jgi:predicted lipoprotein